MKPELSQFANEHYLSLETFRKSGVPVATPVWFIQEDDTIYVETPAHTGKVKRLRHTAVVRVAVCDQRGNVKGPWVDAHAAFVTGAQAQRVRRMLKRKYSWQMGLLHAWGKLRRWQYEVVAIQVHS